MSEIIVTVMASENPSGDSGAKQGGEEENPDLTQFVSHKPFLTVDKTVSHDHPITNSYL